MKRMTHGLISAGGLVACCAAAVQVSQLSDGRAVPDLWNYAITAITSLAGLGLTGMSLWKSPVANPTDSVPADHPILIAALDRLFAHFPDNESAREAVRVVARAVTERRYRSGKNEN